jgi:hypothetical protein
MSLYLCHQPGQQLLSLDRADAVEGKQVEHVNLADRVPAKLDAADLGLRPADRPGRCLRGDPAALSEPPQLGAEQDAQYSRPLRRLWHEALRMSVPLRNCLAQLRGKALPSIFRKRDDISYGIARHPPKLAVWPSRPRHFRLDTSVPLEPAMTVKILSTCGGSGVLRHQCQTRRPWCRTRRPRPTAAAVPWCAVRRLGRPSSQARNRGGGAPGLPASAVSAGMRTARKETRR